MSFLVKWTIKASVKKYTGNETGIDNSSYGIKNGYKKKRFGDIPESHTSLNN